MTPDDLQRTYDGRKYKSPANDTEIMSVVPLLIELWKAADKVMWKYSDLMDTESNLYWGNLDKALEKLKETK